MKTAKTQREKKWSFPTLLSIITLLIALSLAVLYSDPTLCLKIPEIGWLLHTIITGKAPPPYVDISEVYSLEEMRQWTKDGDVIVSTLAKAGTTWMLYICHLIRTRGDPHNKYGPFEINMHTPWPTFRHHPKQTWSELKEMLNDTVISEGVNVKDLWDHPDYLFRVFKAHEAPVSHTNNSSPIAVLPVKEMPNIRFLAMVRDTPDMLASFYHFTGSHSPDFRRIWGGCPFAFSSPCQMLDLLFNPPKFLEPDRKKILGWQLLEYAKLWMEYKNEPNVLLLHYNDALKDLPGTISKISTFLGVDLTEDEINLISEKASFKSMHKLTHAFNYRLWAYPSHNDGKTTAIMPGKQIRKGVMGDSLNLFTARELAEIRAYQSEFYGSVGGGGEDMLHWIREGGPLP